MYGRQLYIRRINNEYTYSVYCTEIIKDRLDFYRTGQYNRAGFYAPSRALWPS